MQRKLCHFHQPHYSVTIITLLHVLLKSHNAEINILILSPNTDEKFVCKQAALRSSCATLRE